MSIEEMVASNVRIQFRHAQGGCSCLLPSHEECLYQLDVPDHVAGGDGEAVQGDADEVQEEADENWNPLREFLARPGHLYSVQMIMRPVLDYIQTLIDQNGYEFIVQELDVTPEFIVHFYEMIWTADN